MIQKLLNNKQEIFRFVINGVLATLLDFLVFGLIIFLSNPKSFDNNLIKSFTSSRDLIKSEVVILASIIAFTISLIANYILSIIFVFEDSEKGKTLKGAILFIALSLIGLLLNTLIVFVGFDTMKLNQWLVKFIATCLILIYNYVTRKVFIFKKV